MDRYINIHVHSQKSILDGLNSPDELVRRAVELKQPALTITDHGSVSAHREFQKACMDAEIKPLLGVELYFAVDRFDRTPVKKREDNTGLYSHLIVIAKNQNGLNNLNKIVEESWKSYYYKPLTDFTLLDEYGDDLIVTTACMGGAIAKLILGEREDVAEQMFLQFKARFGDDFYTEIQAHNPPELNTALIDLSTKHSVKMVAATDAHYAVEEDRAVEEALLILSTHPKMGEGVTIEGAVKYKTWIEKFNYLYPDRVMSFQDIDLFLQSREQMQKALKEAGIDDESLLDNTMEIADKVEGYDYHSGLDLLPKPVGVDPITLVKSLCEDALKKKGLGSEYRERLEYELSVIEQKNFGTYFLIVRDIINWAKGSGILVGPGRGSAAGSLVCYLLNITTIDPIEYKLLFDRFINIDRNDFPDVDSDIQDNRRSEVKDYIRNRFGNDKVCGISTYNVFKDKGTFRDAARAFYVPLGDVNRFLKPYESFEECETDPSGQWFRDKYPEVVDLARKLRGRIRGSGIHAAGIVVADQPISNYAPVETRVENPSDPNKTRVPVVALDMGEAEDLGLIKLDILGLKTLSVISDAIGEIKKRRGVEISLGKIPLEDSDVYEMLSAGFTKTVFQCEAAPYTSLLNKMGVSTFNELVASNALVRPGAMDAIGAEYIARSQGRSQIKSIHPIYDDITKDTFGLVIYQEQIMLLCKDLAEMSWSDADKIRKIIGKKKDVREFDAYRDKFLEGASKHIDFKVAEKLWSDFEKSANYSFNLSHAVAYSTVSYWTAWLKKNYTTEFIYAALKNEKDKDVITEYLIEAKRLGVKVLLPHINHSDIDFTIEGDSIRFGLSSIKYISDKVGQKIINARPFASYADLTEKAAVKGSGINKGAIKSLNAIGGASFDDNPKTGKESENYYEYLGIPNFHSNNVDKWGEQVSKLEDFSEKGIFFFYAMVKAIKRGTGWSRIDLVDSSGSAGVFHGANTQVEAGKMYLFLIANNRIERYIESAVLEEDSADPIIRFLNAEELKMDGDKKAVVSFSSRKTKAGKMMGSVIYADKDKVVDSALVFPKIFPLALGRLEPGKAAKMILSRTKDGSLFVEEIM